MIDGQHIPEEDLALYALGAFDEVREAADIAAMKAHLASCGNCNQALAEVNGDLALLALSVEQLPLPAGASQRFMERISAEQRPAASPAVHSVPVPDRAATGASLKHPNGAVASGGVPSKTPLPFPATSARSSVSVALPWMLAAAMLAAAVYLGSEVSQLRASRDLARAESVRLAVEADRAKEVLEVLTAPAAQQVTLTQGKGTPAPMGRTSYMPSKGALVFMASHMPSLPASKAYELWVIPANGHAPMPAGTFRPDEQGTASVLLPPLPAGIPAKAFGVTIERAEGSPVPTSPIIMSGS
ncbi:MAG TPA: anti-sigma factor [Acidisarcina sp.]